MITVSDARARLSEILDRVAQGEEVVLTRHGKPVAVVVNPDALRARGASAALAEAARVRQAIELARGRSLPPDGIGAKRADELVAELRADRDG